MDYSVRQESFDSLASYWTEPGNGLSWNSVFILPAWLRVWWQELGPEAELYMVSVRNGDKIVGIAPLQVREGKASFIGSADVCDYLDFIVVLGVEKDFFSVLLDDLKQKGVNHLDLRALRPDSTVLTQLVDIARSRGDEVICSREDISVEMDLPSTWEEYLEALTKKQRHEVKRKLRRLEEAGNLNHHYFEVNHGDKDLMDTFVYLFSLSRTDKANFMTARMESFFRSLVRAMAEIRLLRLGVLELDGRSVAMLIGFDYNDTLYLYNSAYAPQYNSLSVGLLSKVLCIKESIKEGKKKFDFLKGNETYKYHLGGREVPLYNCQITIK